MNKNRALIIILLFFLLFLVVVYALYDIQVRRHENYKFLAERQQNKIEEIKAMRGVIKDRTGNVIAFSKREVSYYADLRMLKSSGKEQIAEKFAKVFKKKKSYYLSKMQGGKKNVLLEKNVDGLRAEELDGFIAEGLFKEENISRKYPFGTLASHILGYVENSGRGRSGIESVFDSHLRGKNGSRYVERDVWGRTVSVVESQSIPAENGLNVDLTIDAGYQKILETELLDGVQKFMARSASGIIMNPNTGEILALANYPDYDPQEFSAADDEARRNRILTDTYEPGSTIKPLIIAALLNEGIVKEDNVIFAENGSYKFNRTRITDVHPYGNLTVHDVLVNSSNIGMAKLSTKMDDNSFYKYLRDFGFGNRTLINLPGETEGTLKRPSNFNDLTKAFISFGYEVSVTPIQMAAAYCALVNGGTLYQPYIVKSISKNGKAVEKFEPVKIRDVISRETSEKVKKMMVDVVEKGTAKTAKVENISIGGKTGTSQILVDNKYSKGNYNTSFVGFLPAENPKAVCFILVKFPQVGMYGGLVAAPVFKETVEGLIKTDETLIDWNAKADQGNTGFIALKENGSSEKNGTVFSNISEKKIPKETNEIRKIVTSNLMPELYGLSKREATSILNAMGIKYRISGRGKVVSQSVKTGTRISSGTVCIINCAAGR